MMTNQNQTTREIRAFAEAHPHGWNHDDWTGFLQHLVEEGHDVSKPDEIGLALEREHLRLTLRGSGIKGLGPKRIDSVAREFGTLHDLGSVDGGEIASRTGMPRKIARDLAGFLR